MLDGVIVAVKEKSEDLGSRLREEYGCLTPILQIDNTEAAGICAKYNLGIDKVIAEKKCSPEASTRYSWTIFAHDDAVLKTNDFRRSLSSMQKVSADIVGVAGNVSIPKIDPGYWWEGLTDGDFRGSGAVIHRTPNTEKMYHVESYGPYPQQVSCLDGVWFAVRTEILRNTKLRFDSQTFTGYHYYDADFCATARSLGYKIWVGDILFLHDRWGKGVEDSSFKEAQALFIEKWSKQKHLYYLGRPSPSNNPFIKGTSAFK